MKDMVKKSFLLGLGAASMTKSQAEKIVKNLVKNNAVTVKEGKELLKRVKKHATNEGKRIRKFVQQEGKRAAKDLGVASKVHAGKVKKHLKTVHKELSSRGRKTLNKIMKELSKS